MGAAIAALAAAGEGRSSALAESLMQQLEGNGGVGRGPGEAALSFGPPVGSDERFEARALPPGEFPDFASSGLVGVAAGAPEVRPNEQVSAGAEFGSEGVQASFNRRIAPRHRGPVRDFFDSQSDSPR